MSQGGTKMRKSAVAWGILILSLPLIAIGAIQVILWCIGLSFRPPHRQVTEVPGERSEVASGSVVVWGADTIASIHDLVVMHGRSGVRFEVYDGTFRNQRYSTRLRGDST